MKTHDPHLERLINAHLDGRLDDAQRAELFRQLLRNPEVRQRLDLATAIDRMACESLRDALDAPRKTAVRKPNTPWRRATALAAAAMILLALGLWAVFTPDDADRAAAAPLTRADSEPVTPAPGPVELAVETEAPQPVVVTLAEGGPPWWRQPSAGERAAPVEPAHVEPRLTEPRKGRAVIGVLDETTDRFYWLEIEREQSVIESVVGEL